MKRTDFTLLTMIPKLIISAAMGGLAISAILLYHDFNPLHNERWLLTAALIAATGTLTAELTVTKNPRRELQKMLKTNLKALPSTSPEWEASITLLEVLRQAEARKNDQL